MSHILTGKISEDGVMLWRCMLEILYRTKISQQVEKIKQFGFQYLDKQEFPNYPLNKLDNIVFQHESQNRVYSETSTSLHRRHFLWWYPPNIKSYFIQINSRFLQKWSLGGESNSKFSITNGVQRHAANQGVI